MHEYLLMYCIIIVVQLCRYKYLIGNECIAIASHICATVTTKHYTHDTVQCSAVCVCVVHTVHACRASSATVTIDDNGDIISNIRVELLIMM